MGTQGNALKFFMDRFSKGMDGEQGARPRNVYELWGNLFPQLYVNHRTGQPIEPRNLKVQASKYAAKSRAKLGDFLVANDSRADASLPGSSPKSSAAAWRPQPSVARSSTPLAT